jgi:hypothetical protein
MQMKFGLLIIVENEVVLVLVTVIMVPCLTILVDLHHPVFIVVLAVTMTIVVVVEVEVVAWLHLLVGLTVADGNVAWLCLPVTTPVH